MEKVQFPRNVLDKMIFTHQEPGGCDDDALWSGCSISVSLDHAVDDWKQECRGFTRSGLRELCFFHNTLKSD